MLFSSKYLYIFQNIYKKKHLLDNLYKALWEDKESTGCIHFR